MGAHLGAWAIIAPPMGHFPLLRAEELEAARGRWERDRAGDAAWRLRKNVERIAQIPGFSSPLELLRPQSNLFQIQGILFEAALAFALSGEERYLEPLARCVESLGDERLRRERLPGEVHPAWVVVGLAVAHELCGEALEGEAIVELVATMVAELHDSAGREAWGERVRRRNAWNHTAVAFAAIGCGGLLCREHDPRARAWVDDAIERMQLFFADGITEQGMTREGLSYCGFTFRNAAPLLLAARNAGIWDYRSPAENPHVERLRRVPAWYAIETFPGGTWMQTVNDSYWSPRRALGGFLPTFGALDPQLTAWVYEALVGARGNGAHGQDHGMSSSSLFESVLWPPDQVAAAAAEPPEVLADLDVGFVAERVRQAPPSGFSLNCGEFVGSIHDQSDNGSVTLFSGDVALLIDSGAANEPTEGSPSSSHGHNLVLIDGRGQIPCGQGVGCTGRIVHAERHAQATVIGADLTDSYALRGYNPVHHAIRHCVYGKRPFTYLLLLDDFSRPRGERAVFEQLFHTPPVVEHALEQSGVRMRIEFEGAARWMEIRALDEGAEVHETSFTQHDPGLFGEHPVWRLRRVAQHALMPTLVLPYEERPPQVSATCDLANGRVTLIWEAAGEGGTDVLEFSPGVATGARLTRDGTPLPDAELLLG